jgi:hypothetical protein
MATTHAPGAGLGPGDLGRRGRRAAVIAVVVLACAAIVVPLGAHALDHGRAVPTPAARAPATPSITTPERHRPGTGSSLGSRGDLPSLLPAGAPGLSDGALVRIGDITTGVVRRTPAGGWQVLVRWDGRLQPLTSSGPVSLGAGSWVARSGLLYSRVATGTPGRFRVFAWDAQGATAYTPPTLVATSLGEVCFDRTFTAFGGCRAG